MAPSPKAGMPLPLDAERTEGRGEQIPRDRRFDRPIDPFKKGPQGPGAPNVNEIFDLILNPWGALRFPGVTLGSPATPRLAPPLGAERRGRKM